MQVHTRAGFKLSEPGFIVDTNDVFTRLKLGFFYNLCVQHSYAYMASLVFILRIALA